MEYLNRVLLPVDLSISLSAKLNHKRLESNSSLPGVGLPFGLAVDNNVLPRIKDVILRGLQRYRRGLRHYRGNSNKTAARTATRRREKKT